MAFFYLFYGEQTYAIEQAIQKKIREITATQSIDLHNFSVADCLSDNSFFVKLQDAFFTPPFSGNTLNFFSTKTVVPLFSFPLKRKVRSYYFWSAL